jgi:hypothetical protein
LNAINVLDNSKAPIIIDSASGAIATFPDGADGLPLESLVVGIEPVQSGTGDPSPSNVRPISGFTGVNVARTGKNLLNKAAGVPYGIPRFIKFGVNQYGDTVPNKTIKLAAGTYTFSVSGSNSTNYESFAIFDESNTRVAISYNRATYTFTLSKTGFYYITLAVTAENFTTWDNYDLQLESGSEASSYEPYQGETYPITFGDAGTVYGGTVNLVTGKLIVTDAEIESYNGETLPSTWISDRDVYAEGTTPTIGAQVVYKLTEPLVYDLTSIEITTLLGTNNIYADTGDVAVDYRADTKLWIDGHSGSSITVDSALSSTSENPVQNKVINTALAAKEPKHNTTTVSGTTPSIAGVADTRYICGEVSTLTIVAPASGCIDVTFTSGSTPTVLTVTPPTGMTIKWANGFDPTSLDANTTYKVMIADGEYGISISYGESSGHESLYTLIVDETFSQDVVYKNWSLPSAYSEFVINALVAGTDQNTSETNGEALVKLKPNTTQVGFSVLNAVVSSLVRKTSYTEYTFRIKRNPQTGIIEFNAMPFVVTYAQSNIAVVGEIESFELTTKNTSRYIGAGTKIKIYAK